MFDFEKIVMDKFKVTSVTTTMKEICESKTSKGERNANRDIGIYALYLDDNLMKIGRAVTNDGIFTRMKQYYNGRPEGLQEITTDNKDTITVKYFNLPTRRDCWAAEKYLQAEAYYSFENMPWDHEITEKERVVAKETTDDEA